MEKPLDIKALAHIAIAVKDVEPAREFFCSVLGATFQDEEIVEKQGVKTVNLLLGNIHIELLEALGSESPVEKFIAKRGEGVHHLSFEVDDLGASLEALSASGIQLIHQKPQDGIHGSKISFLHPGSTCGVLLELMEKGKKE